MVLGKTVMLFGVGDLGGWVIELLARREGVSRIVACDKREEWGWSKTESAAISAGIEGYNKTIGFETCDVTDIDATSELINRYDPDLIYMSMTLMSYTVAEFFPFKVKRDLQKISGTLIPMHLTLPALLMQAVKQAQSKAVCINHSWPDLVNPMLWRSGLKVNMGAGNVDNVANEIRRKISIQENVPFTDVTLYIIYEHVVNIFGTRTGIPYYFKAVVGDRDITDRYDTDSLISDRTLRVKRDWLSWLIQNKTAAGAVRNIMAVLNDTNEFAHCCGVNGHIGGYPVRINANGATIVLPKEVTMEEAVKINTDGMRYEGVEEIENNGTLVVTDEAYEIAQTLLEIECREIRVSESKYWSEQLSIALKKLAAQYTVDVPFQ